MSQLVSPPVRANNTAPCASAVVKPRFWGTRIWLSKMDTPASSKLSRRRAWILALPELRQPRLISDCWGLHFYTIEQSYTASSRQCRARWNGMSTKKVPSFSQRISLSRSSFTRPHQPRHTAAAMGISQHISIRPRNLIMALLVIIKSSIHACHSRTSPAHFHAFLTQNAPLDILPHYFGHLSGSVLCHRG